MRIDDVINSFNNALNRLRGNKDNNTFVTCDVDVRKLKDHLKESIISIYLVDTKDGSKQLILRSIHKREWSMLSVDRIIDEHFIGVLPNLFIFFKVFGDDMANGTYKSQLENISINE